MSKPATRLRAIALYKELHRLGREYPNPAYNFHDKLRRAFVRYRHAEGEEAERAFALGEYIKRGQCLTSHLLLQFTCYHRNHRPLRIKEVPVPQKPVLPCSPLYN